LIRDNNFSKTRVVIYLESKPAFDAAKAAGEQALRNLNDPDPDVRYQAAKWIARQARRETSNLIEFWLANKRATGALTKALGDTDERVVEEAAVAINHTTSRYFADARAFPALLRLLKSKRPLTRISAVSAAAPLGGEKSIQHVLPLLEDPVGSVRFAAVVALHSLTELATKPWAPNHVLPLGGPASAQGLTRIVAAIVPCLQDKNVEVRARAAVALGSFGDESVLEMLEKASRRERRNPAKDSLKDAVERLKKRMQGR
jgi:HEAT repeat protein